MITEKPTREQALALFKKYNKTESLYHHALAVEAVMRHFAQIYDGDPDEWGVIGLLHDLDYEMYPDEHCIKTKEIMEAEHWPPTYIRAIMSHAYGMCTDVPPETTLEKVLFTIDELTGLINATCLLRPSKSVLDLEVRSVQKKWKDKRFAAGVDRAVISKGIEMLGLERSFVIQETIRGMQAAADSLGLRGNV